MILFSRNNIDWPKRASRTIFVWKKPIYTTDHVTMKPDEIGWWNMKMPMGLQYISRPFTDVMCNHLVFSCVINSYYTRVAIRQWWWWWWWRRWQSSYPRITHTTTHAVNSEFRFYLVCAHNITYYTQYNRIMLIIITTCKTRIYYIIIIITRAYFVMIKR